MTKTLSKLLLAFALFFGATQAFAGAGHSHTVSDGTIKMNAKKHLQRLASKQKIESSWSDAKFVAMKKQGIVSKEWVVSYQNDKISDTNKKVIYVYLTTYGKVKGANYQGN